MNINVEGYFKTIHAPWGQLFYKLLWNHLKFEDKKILDFGSGFGITSDFLSKKNEVIAIEPNEEMLKFRDENGTYQQIRGSIEELKKIPDKSMDVILCHNVLEYVDNREEVIKEFYRILKKDGLLSIIKHNKAGKVMQKVVFENKIEDAMSLLHHGQTLSANFGVINEYDMEELEQYIKGMFQIENIYGIRTFFALQSNEFKIDPRWGDRMYEIETEVESIPVYRDVAFFHHIIMRK